MKVDWEFDEQVRNAGFAFLRALQLRTGGPVTRDDLSGFTVEGRPFRLIAPRQGIWKPAVLPAALSFITKYAEKPSDRPYQDGTGPDGFERYKWRGTDAHQSDNRALRTAMNARRPLIWFQGIAKGVFIPIFPVHLVAEEPTSHQFVVALDDEQAANWTDLRQTDPQAARRYALQTTQRRLHQPMFRERVLYAYRHRCAICRLKHHELLDAAHIRADSNGGEPVVSNGISMCKIHHAAYDTNLLGIDPDRTIHIRDALLDETDGPTLKHSFQELHLSRLSVPRAEGAKPDSNLLAERYEQFRAS